MQPDLMIDDLPNILDDALASEHGDEHASSREDDPNTPAVAANGRRRRFAATTHGEHMHTLLVATSRGDHDAFRELYGLVADHLFGFAARMLRSEAMAQDVLQDAFISIWNNADRYNPALAAPCTWMLSIVRNRALDVIRKHRREIHAERDASDEADALMEVPPEVPGPEERIVARRESSMVMQRLASLASHQREAITLAFFGDRTYREVANAMGIPVGTAKSWIRRGLIELRDGLAPGH